MKAEDRVKVLAGLDYFEAEVRKLKNEGKRRHLLDKASAYRHGLDGRMPRWVVQAMNIAGRVDRSEREEYERLKKKFGD